MHVDVPFYRDACASRLEPPADGPDQILSDGRGKEHAIFGYEEVPNEIEEECRSWTYR